jgi:hypothetical protein
MILKRYDVKEKHNNNTSNNFVLLDVDMFCGRDNKDTLFIFLPMLRIGHWLLPDSQSITN